MVLHCLEGRRWSNHALRVSPAVTRLTVYRRLQVSRRAENDTFIENFCNWQICPDANARVVDINLQPAVDRQPAHRRGDRRASSKKTLKNIARSCQKHS